MSFMDGVPYACLLSPSIVSQALATLALHNAALRL
jgi:hypothetical protein